GGTGKRRGWGRSDSALCIAVTPPPCRTSSSTRLRPTKPVEPVTNALFISAPRFGYAVEADGRSRAGESSTRSVVCQIEVRRAHPQPKRPCTEAEPLARLDRMARLEATRSGSSGRPRLQSPPHPRSPPPPRLSPP